MPGRQLRDAKAALSSLASRLRPAPQEGGDSETLDDAYRSGWNENARTDAMTAILTPPDGTANVEATFDALGQQDAEWLRTWIDPDAAVLDLGCGIGRIEKHLA